jgi:hypothetical protein
MRRIMTLLIVTCTLLSLSIWLSPAGEAAPQTLAGYSSGYAHGGDATIPANPSGNSSQTFVGPLAPIWNGCNATANVTRSNSAAEASLSTLAGVSSVKSTVTTQRGTSQISAQAISNVQGVSILNGLITVGQIITEANSVGTANGASSNDTGSKIVGLSITGLSPINYLPKPNTRIQIPGVGYIVLNEQVGPYNGPNSTSLSINMIHVHITSTTIPGVLANTDIVVGNANSSFFRTSVPALVNGNTYAFSLLGNEGNNTGSVTPVAGAEIGCAGGTQQNNINNSNLSNVGSTGVVNDSASGQIAQSGASVTTTSNITNLNLLNGLIQGPAITSTVHASWDGAGTGKGSVSVNLSNMTIAGTKLNASSQPNTRISLAGLGYVIVNEQFSQISSSSVKEIVNALDIVVTTSNSFDLPIGAQLIVGYASASISGYSS